jgi:hypothetical protein
VCVCDRVVTGVCYYCKNPRNPEEREAFIRAGIASEEVKETQRAVTREEQFEAERARIRKAELAKRRAKKVR